MKSLYITNLGLLDNLAQTQILPYLEGLAKKGVKISILSYEKKDNLSDTAQIAGIAGRLGALGINWYRLEYHYRWGNILDVAAGWWKAAAIIRQEKIAVLHARSSIPVMIAYPLSRIFKLKLIYDRRGTLAGDFVDDVNPKNLFSFEKFSAILNKLDEAVIRNSDATIVLTEKARETLAESKYVMRRNAKLYSIPCSVDISKFDNLPDRKIIGVDLKGRFVLSYLGSLGTCYLLKEMADYFKIVREIKPNAVFLIISHTDRGFIREHLDKESLSFPGGYMIVSGKPDEVPGYISLADVSIVFYKRAWSQTETSPTKFGESLAAGVPVIVNKGIGDTEDIIINESIGSVVEGFTRDAYKRSFQDILRLLEDKKALNEKCRAAAEKYFSLVRGIEKYANVYRELER